MIIEGKKDSYLGVTPDAASYNRRQLIIFGGFEELPESHQLPVLQPSCPCVSCATSGHADWEALLRLIVWYYWVSRTSRLEIIHFLTELTSRLCRKQLLVKRITTGIKTESMLAVLVKKLPNDSHKFIKTFRLELTHPNWLEFKN